MNWQTLSALLASAGLMVACGGGGGGDSSMPADSGTDASVTLSGTAAKGLMANADVKVHPIKSDGSVDTATVLASTTTNDKGKYTLPVFKVPKGQPYVVKVTANANTTHVDEISGTQPLPSGFSMRTVRVAPTTSTAATITNASVTPFTEMAVAAAAKASGGVTATNADNAVKTVTQVIGFDPTTVEPVASIDATTLGEQKKLAVMLTAVAQMANSGDLGCSGSSGEKTQCVVDKLASAADITTKKLKIGSTDVSATLSTAVTTVLTGTSLSNSVGSALLVDVVASLSCTEATGTTSASNSCTPASSSTTPSVNAAAAAIASAKLLFAQIKSDWTTMFSGGGASSLATGAANQQAWAFKQAMTDIRVPVDVMAKDVGVIAMAIDYYNDYKAGRTTSNGRNRGDSDNVANDGYYLSTQFAIPASCGVYQDVDTTVVATAASNANYIGCGARYFVTASYSGSNIVRTEWRHGFTITPLADGTFTYVARARKRVLNCPTAGGACTLVSNTALQADASNADYGRFTGTVTPTLSGTNGDITKLVIAGDLPAAFVNGGTAIDTHAYKHTLAFEGTQTQNADGTVSSAASGTLVAKTSAGATVSTVTLKPSSSMQLPVSFDANGNQMAGNANSGAHTQGALSLNLMFTNATGEFEGLLALTDTAWDKSQTVLAPTKATLSGALRTLSGGTATEFLKGVFSASTSGFASYDATAANSASNSFSTQVSFTGTITAPSRPALELSIGTGLVNDSDAGRSTGMTMTYRTLVNGTPRTVVTLTGTPNASGSGMSSLKLTEATSNLALTWAPGDSSVDLWLGTTSKIGTLAVSSGVLTFTDNSFISLDIGL